MIACRAEVEQEGGHCHPRCHCQDGYSAACHEGLKTRCNGLSQYFATSPDCAVYTAPASQALAEAIIAFPELLCGISCPDPAHATW